ncbi:hypothetical protein TYRP_001545 [Tyrophagus putrescentiae]|nr:hypothetical protein TYRP_001545 [Tyrophagus putrescentiae]
MKLAVLLVVAIAAVVVSGDESDQIVPYATIDPETWARMPDSIKNLIIGNPNLKKELDEVRLKAFEALKANNAKLAGGKANRGDGAPKLGVSIEDFGIVSGIIKETSNLVDSAKILADSIDRAISG